MTRTKIDLDSWSRKNTFFFMQSNKISWGTMWDTVDISSAYFFSKKNGFPLTPIVMYLLTRTANSIRAFRYRTEGGDVFEYSVVHARGIALIEGPADDDPTTALYHVDYTDDPIEFMRRERAASRRAVEREKALADGKSMPGDDGSVREDQVLISIMPWRSFHGATVIYDGVSTVPSFVCGKIFKEDGGKTVKMPLFIDIRHEFGDGYHLCLFLNRLESFARELTASPT